MSREICRHGVILFDRDCSTNFCAKCADRSDLEDEAERLADELSDAEEDNARLRELIAEAMHQKMMTNLCPWCRQHIDSIDDVHEPDCPAFTPDGVVK